MAPSLSQPSTTDDVWSVRVPETLRRYLGRRCDNPDAVLVDILGTSPIGRSLSIPSVADVHRGLSGCDLGATTVMVSKPSGIETTIVNAKWAVRAGPTSTDVILPTFPEAMRARFRAGLLGDKLELSFLPDGLAIDALVDQGAGVLIRCQPVLFDLAFASQHRNYDLSDVCGRVSGSDGGF